MYIYVMCCVYVYIYTYLRIFSYRYKQQVHDMHQECQQLQSQLHTLTNKYDELIILNMEQKT